MSHPLPRLAWGALITLWGLTGATTYWAMDRQEPVEIVGQPQVLTPVVRPGERLDVRWCVYHREQIETYRLERLFDGAGAEVAEEHTAWRYAVGPTTLPGQPDCYVQGMTVPADAKPGWGRYRVIVSWRRRYNIIHLFWPVTRVLPDVAFRIE